MLQCDQDLVHRSEFVKNSVLASVVAEIPQKYRSRSNSVKTGIQDQISQTNERKLFSYSVLFLQQSIKTRTAVMGAQSKGGRGRNGDITRIKGDWLSECADQWHATRPVIIIASRTTTCRVHWSWFEQKLVLCPSLLQIGTVFATVLCF